MFTPWYSWNIAKVGVNHQSINHLVSDLYVTAHTRLPPIKGGSAPIEKKRERISFRNPQNKNTDIGWGGGKKRVVHWIIICSVLKIA